MKFVSIPFDWIERHAAGAVRQGVPLESLLASSLIDRRFGDRRDAVSPTQYLLLCMNTVMAVEDATHGLARTKVGALYPAVGLKMALGCSNLEGAIHALCRLYLSASNAVHIQLKTEGGSAILMIHIDAANERDAIYLEENYLLWIFQHCLYFLGRALPVSAITVRDPFHFNRGRPHWAVGAPVRYGDVTSFRFPRTLLGERPAARAGANVMWECQRMWLGFIERGRAPTAAADYVAASGFVRFADIVRGSGTSANTVRRHFRASTGGFRDVRQRALVEAASNRLKTGDASVEAIAVELGYSDARSFRRFLKNATGLTPQQVRERQRAGEAKEDFRALLELEEICGRMSI